MTKEHVLKGTALINNALSLIGYRSQPGAALRSQAPGLTLCGSGFVLSVVV